MRKISFFIFIAISLAACSSEQAVSPGGPDPDPETEAAEDSSATKASVLGKSIVYLSDDLASLIEKDVASGKVLTKSDGLNAALSEIGVTSMRRLFPDAGEYEPRTRAEGLHRWYVVSYDKKTPLTRAENTLSSVDGILEIEPVRKPVLTATDDRYYSRQWALSNNGVDINVEGVWNEYTTGSPNVIVAVVDEGVEISHPDLEGVVLSEAEGSRNFAASGSITGGDHGTHVAGIIAAVRNNGKGIAGIAGGDYAAGKKGVRILSCQIFATNAKGETVGGDESEAIKWGADHGAVISQNSWGYDADGDGDGKISDQERADYLSMTIPSYTKAAIDYFIKYAGCDNSGNQLPDSPMKGGLVVFAAGNDALPYDVPSYYPPVVAVGAMDSQGAQASYSNYGDWVDLAAPGTGIFSTVTDSRYSSMSGTSMACPQVSGVASLVVSYRGGPGFTADSLKNILISSANKNLPMKSTIGPLVDAFRAVTYGEPVVVPPVEEYSVEALSNTIHFSITVPSSDKGVRPHGFLAVAAKDPSSIISPLAITRGGAASVSVLTGDTPAGDKVEAVIEGLDFDTKYYTTVFPFNYARDYGQRTDVKEATTLKNNPPVITVSEPTTLTMKAFETRNVPMAISDPDGHDFTVTVSAGSEGVSVRRDDDGTYSLRIAGPAVLKGSYAATVTATDSYGGSSSVVFNYTVEENHPPYLASEIPGILSEEAGKRHSIDLSQYFKDDDGEDLTYTSSPSALLNGNSVNGSTLYITMSTNGMADLTVTATDGLGASATGSFKVILRPPGLGFDAYPSPFRDQLTVASGADKVETRVKIVSSTGGVVIDRKETFSVFDPLVLDTSSLGRGTYKIFVTYGGKEYSRSIVKI